ncbi:hypothetical protein Tco_0797788 [Tanacetum coccineum]
MTSTHQQSLADVGSETRPPMLEREISPYKFKKKPATDTADKMTETEDDLAGDDLKQYEADIDAMNLILLYIPNDIYNSVDACENAKDMWDRVNRLMYGTELRLVNASKEKRNAKTHDPLTLVTNTYNQAVVQANQEDIKIRNVGIVVDMLHARDYLKPRVQDSKYFPEQMLLAKKDEAGILLTNEHNDFLLADASEVEEFEDLNDTICIVRI